MGEYQCTERVEKICAGGATVQLKDRLFPGGVSSAISQIGSRLLKSIKDWEIWKKWKIKPIFWHSLLLASSTAS